MKIRPFHPCIQEDIKVEKKRQTDAHSDVKPASVLLANRCIEIFIVHSLAHVGRLVICCNFDIGALNMYY